MDHFGQKDRLIKIRYLRNRFETASDIQKHCDLVEKCSNTTIKNRLKDLISEDVLLYTNHSSQRKTKN